MRLRKKKEQRIQYLLESGYTYKEIMRECHVSPSTIAIINKTRLGYSQNEILKPAAQISNETKALKLYDENKEPLDVSIQLNIPAEEATLYHQKYQKLKSLPLNESCMKLKSELSRLELLKQNKTVDLNNLKDLLADHLRAIEYISKKCDQKRNELLILDYYANNARAFLSN